MSTVVYLKINSTCKVVESFVKTINKKTTELIEESAKTIYCGP